MTNKEPVVLLNFSSGGTLNDSNYAEYANRVMSKKDEYFPNLTTSKLRSIYGLIMNLYTKIGSSADYEKHKGDIQYLKVKMAYEAGRDSKPDKPSDVKVFIQKTALMAVLGSIDDYNKFLLYCRYAESLVAYFKYYGGRDN